MVPVKVISVVAFRLVRPLTPALVAPRLAIVILAPLTPSPERAVVAPIAPLVVTLPVPAANVSDLAPSMVLLKVIPPLAETTTSAPKVVIPVAAKAPLPRFMVASFRRMPPLPELRVKLLLDAELL